MLGKIIHSIFLNSSKFKGTETPFIFAPAFINSFLSCRSFVRICLAFFPVADSVFSFHHTSQYGDQDAKDMATEKLKELKKKN